MALELTEFSFDSASMQESLPGVSVPAVSVPS